MCVERTSRRPRRLTVSDPHARTLQALGVTSGTSKPRPRYFKLRTHHPLGFATWPRLFFARTRKWPVWFSRIMSYEQTRRLCHMASATVYCSSVRLFDDQAMYPLFNKYPVPLVPRPLALGQCGPLCGPLHVIMASCGASMLCIVCCLALAVLSAFVYVAAVRSQPRVPRGIQPAETNIRGSTLRSKDTNPERRLNF